MERLVLLTCVIAAVSQSGVMICAATVDDVTNKIEESTTLQQESQPTTDAFPDLNNDLYKLSQTIIKNLGNGKLPHLIYEVARRKKKTKSDTIYQQVFQNYDEQQRLQNSIEDMLLVKHRTTAPDMSFNQEMLEKIFGKSTTNTVNENRYYTDTKNACSSLSFREDTLNKIFGLRNPCDVKEEKTEKIITTLSENIAYKKSMMDIIFGNRNTTTEYTLLPRSTSPPTDSYKKSVFHPIFDDEDPGEPLNSALNAAWQNGYEPNQELHYEPVHESDYDLRFESPYDLHHEHGEPAYDLPDIPEQRRYEQRHNDQKEPHSTTQRCTDNHLIHGIQQEGEDFKKHVLEHIFQPHEEQPERDEWLNPNWK